MKSRPNQVFIEFKESSVHVLDGTDGAEFPLERAAAGRVTATSANVVSNALRGFLQRNGPAAARSALCAVPARGVTLRTISLPGAAKDDPGRLLAMQIEAQFPVSPSELSWGYTPLASAIGKSGHGNGGPAGQVEFLVAAVRRELLQDYSTLLSSCGLIPHFTVAGLARAAAANGATSFGLLEVGNERSELIVIDEHSAPALRVLNWGRAQGEDIENLRAALPQNVAPMIYVSSVHPPAQAIAAALNGNLRAEALPVPAGPGVTAATHGLRTLHAQGRPILLLGPKEESRETFVFPAPWKWAGVAVALLLGSFALRYAEPLLFRSQLNGKLAELTKYRGTLPKLERELGFLTYIKTNQPPYLDVAAVVASAAPPGTKFEQFSMVSRGQISLRGSIQNPQGPEQFRSKLIDSGFFSKVVVEEQGRSTSPQDRDKVTFRITGTLKADGARPVLPPEPPLTNMTSSGSAPMPGGMPPSGMMPPGMMPPGALPMPPGALPMPPGAMPMPPGARPMPPGRPMPSSMPQPMPVPH